MTSLLVALNVISPLFLMITLGYFLRVRNLVDDHALTIMNNICFRVFLPILLFNNIYSTNLDGLFNPKLITFAVLSILIIFIFLFVLIPIVEKNNKKRGVMIQAMFRSNFVIFGISISSSLYGDENLGIASLLVAVIVPIFNILAVVSLEIFRKGKINIKRITIGIIKNPLIIACAIGILFLLTDIKVPFVFETTINKLSKIATPLILVTLGGFLTFRTINGHLRQLFITIIGRLVLIPAVFIPIAIQLGFRDVELTSLLTLFAAPTAVSSFTMAKQMDADAELSSHIVVFSSAISILTFFLWIFILKQYGYI